MERIEIGEPTHVMKVSGYMEARARIINGVEYDFQRNFHKNGEACEVLATRMSDLKIVHRWTK